MLKAVKKSKVVSYFCRMNIEQEIKLRMQLDKMHKWPDVYLYKFVLPKDQTKIDQLLSNFTEKADVSVRESAKGNYVSVTIKEVMFSTDAVVERYKSISAIEGLMSL